MRRMIYPKYIHNIRIYSKNDDSNFIAFSLINSRKESYATIGEIITILKEKTSSKNKIMLNVNGNYHNYPLPGTILYAITSIAYDDINNSSKSIGFTYIDNTLIKDASTKEITGVQTQISYAQSNIFSIYNTVDDAVSEII